jgi:cytoskeletal protein CcmA (bactofilin family)
MLILLTSYTVFGRVEFINWMNGSATGLDDMENKKEINDKNKRNKKEVEKQKYTKFVETRPTGKHSSVSLGPMNKPTETLKSVLKIVAKTEEFQEVTKNFMCVVQGLGQFKNTIYTREIISGEEVYVCEVGTKFDGVIVCLGTEVCNVKSSGSGWCVQHNLPNLTWIANHPLKYFEFDPVNINGFTIAGVSGYTYKPAEAELSRSLPITGNFSLQFKSSAIGIMNKLFGILPDKIKIDTAEYWFRRNVNSHYNQLKNSSTNKLLNNVDPLSALEIIDTSRQYGQLTDVGHFWRLNSVECDLPFDWLMKNNFSCKMKGCKVVDNHFEFDTQKLIGSKTRYYHTCMLKFSSMTENFQTYDVTGNNMMCASKRMIASRDNEVLYQANQISILKIFIENGIVRNSSAKYLNVYFNDVFCPLGVLESNYTDCMDHSTDYDGIYKKFIQDNDLQGSSCLGKIEDFKLKGSCTIGSLGNISREGPPAHFLPVFDFRGIFTPIFVKNVKKFLQINDSLSKIRGSRFTRNMIDYVVDQIYDSAHWSYYNMYRECVNIQETYNFRASAAEIKHIKKELRKNYVKGIKLHISYDKLVQSLDAMVKREFAKIGKVPRLYVTYDRGCMSDPMLPELIKMCFVEDVVGRFTCKDRVVNWTIRVMAKPKPSSIEDIFRDLIESVNIPDTVFICIYSDDSVYGGNVNDKPFLYNVDISSCDSSNMELIGCLLYELMTNFSEDGAKSLIDQLKLPIYLINPDNQYESLILFFHSIFEGSGSVLTTVLNHLASTLIALSFLSCLECDFEGSMSTEECIIEGAKVVGHKVTLEFCGIDGAIVFEKIQFLKMSPMLSTDNEWIPVRNYGCIFRGLGCVEGDLQAKQLNLDEDVFKRTDWNDRCQMYVSSVIRGYCHEPQTRVMEALRTKFCSGTHTTKPNVVFEYISEYDPKCYKGKVISEISFCRRYNINSGDIDELIYQIGMIHLGMDCPSVCVSRFYAIDYGAKDET